MSPQKARSSSADRCGKPRQAWYPMTSTAGPQSAAATRASTEGMSAPARHAGVREKSVVPRASTVHLLSRDGWGSSGGRRKWVTWRFQAIRAGRAPNRRAALLDAAGEALDELLLREEVEGEDRHHR